MHDVFKYDMFMPVLVCLLNAHTNLHIHVSFGLGRDRLPISVFICLGFAGPRHSRNISCSAAVLLLKAAGDVLDSTCMFLMFELPFLQKISHLKT